MSALFSESSYFFAMDSETGKVLWDYTPEHSLRNNTIAIGGGSVYLIDRPKAAIDRQTYAQQARRGDNGQRSPVHEPGALLALDAKTGRLQWDSHDNVYGTMLALSEKYDVLLMGYQFTRFRQNSEVGDELSAFRASDGNPLWDVEIEKTPGYGSLSRAIVNDKTVYLEPNAYNLETGDLLDFEMRRSYGCGIIASSSNVLVFRSATFGYVDLQEDVGTENYGGIRPGCWINAIPAGGLVLMPDATSGCTCSYLNRASVALQPYGTR
jgi:putative pyrroloquinoline-quinone binding quinoprotein